MKAAGIDVAHKTLEVVVSVGEKAGKALMEVSDNGAGIPADILLQRGVANLILLGDAQAIKLRATQLGLSLLGVQVVDPNDPEHVLGATTEGLKGLMSKDDFGRLKLLPVEEAVKAGNGADFWAEQKAKHGGQLPPNLGVDEPPLGVERARGLAPRGEEFKPYPLDGLTRHAPPGSPMTAGTYPVVTGLSWADSFRPGWEAWFDRQMRALEPFEVTVTFCFTPEHRGVRPHHTSPPVEPAEFAELVDDTKAAWKALGKALVAAGDPAGALTAYERGIAVAEAKGDIQAAREMKVFAKRLLKTPGESA